MLRHLPLILQLGCAALSLSAQAQQQFAPKSMAYVLQADRLGKSRADCVAALTQSGRDVIVLDASFNQDSGGEWTRAELDTIRKGKAGRRIIAYVSIGEAEDYRPYWKASWDANKDGKPDAGAPAFLNIENPDWKGNYRVRYWHKEWQNLMLPAVDKVVSQGFDGIYLDIVDAFEFYEFDPKTKKWRDNLKNPETGNTYRQDMVAWVKAIATHGRQHFPAFMVFPQNGSALLEHEDYRQVVSGIGVEDLFVEDKRLRSDREMAYVTGHLKLLQAMGKPILVIDYPLADSVYSGAHKKAAQAGFTLLLTDRELTTLGQSGPLVPVLK